MIARLKGVLISRHPDQVIVDVGGVGYRVFLSLTSFYELPQPGQEVELNIHTVVREDAIHLYGFTTGEEKSTFALLTSVSKVGPKLALSILSGITSAELWQAVQTKNTGRLVNIPGIGKKTAARLLLELEGKLPQAAEQIAPLAAEAPLSALEDALSALTNLGYPENQAQKMVDKAAQALDGPATVEDLLRKALKGAG
ncbi:Holliday junction branch migration protein RuvA [Dethiosulfatarculus sandiegensis]|uniref:Holliday junction branch migration complex subunit RuvA n=1 Tax=Dethiosulfatarculus sandiegensis TaxID=1429043 RepID=A0A0D2J4X5_9BACT|nr:Holliday junction branch migration protein RuvA [Dethiosulfatarculus sandiegensis]KIX10771.1 ATP-dependent DNA helicase RuvA [Dethiosulfatarculus sandiegensis]